MRTQRDGIDAEVGKERSRRRRNLACEDCGPSHLVAFSCKGRGCCPSCPGRRMNEISANLIEQVLPPHAGLRQGVLTFPVLIEAPAVAGRCAARPAGAHLVEMFYAGRAAEEGVAGAKT